MKLNLVWCATTEYLNGYINIDPSAPPNSQGILQGEPDKLDNLIDDAECEEIRAINVLEYYSIHQVGLVLKHWISKLAHGGTLTIGCVDVREVSKAVCNADISIEDTNLFLHGLQRSPIDFKRSNYTVSQIAEVLKNKGLKVVSKKVENLQCIVKAIRP